ncbi:NfeD family protein [Limobrevibacterium gyesilva]|uniref:Nodulation protein NfeD n=1 Tax=Limobrevibacterium gyesilva TaxID=2991712 RepID=A0AA42CHA7_9PROT|nr:nodulation protein NfeD [Limobrevibacterium gyesilva]MCW3474782.1 nodulation protein NfeD [Limobrevibacterium gyesilva]
MCWLVGLLGFVLALGAPPAAAADSAPRSAVVIALDGPIGTATADYVVRSLREAQQQDAAVAVLRMDTPGGLDSAMRDIIRAMLASPVPVLAYVAPSGARAASAGTYILYAAALAAMAPGTNLGAATPVSLFGPTDLPEPQGTPAKPPADQPAKTDQPAARTPRDALLTKVTNDSAAYIRGLATLHGRNADWAEKAVREAVSLSYDAALDQHVIDLVADDPADLLTKADGRTVVVHGKPVTLATHGLQIVQIEPGWRDRLLGLLSDPSIIYLLLLAGVFGVAFEMSHPGVFAPGVFGTICLLIGGYGLNLLPVDYAGLALALLGLGLMVTEAFVPVFGAFVLGGASAFAIGSLMIFRTAGARPPVALITGATAVSVMLFGVVLVLLLRARRHPTVTGTAALIGRTGQAVAWAGSEGQVLVQGERWNARAAQPLQPGQAVRVVGRDGLTLLVEVP